MNELTPEEESAYNRDAYGTPLGKPYRVTVAQRTCEGCGSADVPGDSLNRFCNDCWEEGEDYDARMDDESAKLWPGGYDNL